MESFEQFNYAVRPNKNVERKVILEGLAALTTDFPFAAYRYVGFGSMWFTDFILAHRLLGITDMISIQEEVSFAKRSAYNAPYACIEVKPGDAATVLPTLPLHEGPAVLWLDYETTLNRVLSELGDLCARLESGSVLLVTINASKDTVTVSRESERRAKQEALFRETYGFASPPAFSADFFDRINYPANIGATLIRHLSHATHVAGRGMQFETLVNISYRDAAPMVTVGGMITNAVDRVRLTHARASLPAPFAFMKSTEQIRISVPPLTTREKLALDQLFPAATTPTEAAVVALGFPLKQEQIDAYEKHYSRYPVFGELIP